MFCNSCGTNIGERAGLCNDCQSARNRQIQADNASNPKKNKNLIPIIIFGAIFVSLLVVAGVVFLLKKSVVNFSQTAESTFQEMSEEMNRPAASYKSNVDQALDIETSVMEAVVISNGMKISVNKNSLSLIEIRRLMGSYLSRNYPGHKFLYSFGTTAGETNRLMMRYGYMGSVVLFEGKKHVVKLQANDNDGRWKIARILKADELDKAHPTEIERVSQSNDRLTHFYIVTTAAQHFENKLKAEGLAQNVRNENFKCWMTRAEKHGIASCRISYVMIGKDENTCERKNLLLKGSGKNWRVESEIPWEQEIDSWNGALRAAKQHRLNGATCNQYPWEQKYQNLRDAKQLKPRLLKEQGDKAHEELGKGDTKKGS